MMLLAGRRRLAMRGVTALAGAFVDYAGEFLASFVTPYGLTSKPHGPIPQFPRSLSRESVLPRLPPVGWVNLGLTGLGEIGSMLRLRELPAGCAAGGTHFPPIRVEHRP